MPSDSTDPTSPSGPGNDITRRRAILLRQVEAAPGGRIVKGDANKSVPAGEKRAGLTTAEANRVREALVANGHLAAETTGRVAAYMLTPAGAAYLDTIRGFLPTAPGVRLPANDRVRRAREAYLLMQLFRAPGRRLTRGEANKFGTNAAEVLDLNPPTARHVRGELAAAGYLSVAPTGRTESYALTPAGRLYLGALSDFPDLVFPLSGDTLADLLEAARESAKQFEDAKPSGPQRSSGPPAPAELAAVILSAFDELRQERYAATGVVPVFEVRAEVRRRLGPESGRHEVFDEAVLGLWRTKRILITPIVFRAEATPEQLADSLPGLGETLFYLEVAREPAEV